MASRERHEVARDLGRRREDLGKSLAPGEASYLLAQERHFTFQSGRYQPLSPDCADGTHYDATKRARQGLCRVDMSPNKEKIDWAYGRMNISPDVYFYVVYVRCVCL